MVDRHVRLVVGAELGAVLERGFTSQAAAPALPPALLYVLADGQQLMDAVGAGAWRATDARFAGEAALDAYALPVLHAFFDERRGRAPGTPEQEFGDALVANLHPAGSLFDHYLARLFANPGAALARGHRHQPYALALRSAELDMATPGAARRRRFTVCSAIYDAAAQRAFLDAAYTCFERYYVNGIERFGQRHAEQLLTTCWDGFRRAAGELLPRFRAPSLAGEGEWIATAPLRAPEQFERDGHLLVPALALRSHKRAAPALPIAHALVHETLPQALAADGLRQFFRAHQLPVRVSPA